MKIEDVKLGQLLKSDKFGITVKVVQIDATDERVPVEVAYVDGNADVDTSRFSDPYHSFLNGNTQWLYATSLRSSDNYLTLRDLEPTTLKPSHLKVGDVLVHPESNILLSVYAIEMSDGAMSVELKVIGSSNNGKIYHAGNKETRSLLLGSIYWFFNTKADAKGEGFYDSADTIITLEDLVFKIIEDEDAEDCEDTEDEYTSCSEIGEIWAPKLPLASDLRERLKNNVRVEFIQKVEQAVKNFQSSIKMDAEKIAIILPELTSAGYHINQNNVSW